MGQKRCNILYTASTAHIIRQHQNITSHSLKVHVTSLLSFKLNLNDNLTFLYFHPRCVICSGHPPGKCRPYCLRVSRSPSIVNYASFVSHCYANCGVGRGHRRLATNTEQDEGILGTTKLTQRNNNSSTDQVKSTN
jgi:hypothetical protein